MAEPLECRCTTCQRARELEADLRFLIGITDRLNARSISMEEAERIGRIRGSLT